VLVPSVRQSWVAEIALDAYTFPPLEPLLAKEATTMQQTMENLPTRIDVTNQRRTATDGFGDTSEYGGLAAEGIK